jgi:MinD-like ATPase involved in chromosome partitioning or flagellar assembly
MHPAEAGSVLARRELEARASAPLSGPTRFVPVLARKGGVGKTTTSVLLGATLASLRTDRVLALDANPDRGTLAERITRDASTTVRNVVQAAGTVETFADMSRLVSRDPSRLDVIASDTDPMLSEAFNDFDYEIISELVRKHYALVLTDCGTGMVHPVQRAALDTADSIVLVAGVAVDEAKLASETLTWLDAHGYSHLAARAVVVINNDNGTRRVDVDELQRHFARRCRAVVRIPYDAHLAEGAIVSLEQLAPATRAAALELAAHVLDGIRDPD